VIFTINLQGLAAFYRQVVGMRVVKTDPYHIVLDTDAFRLTVHQIPEQFAKNIAIAVPPMVRETAAIKLSFPVDSISRARREATALGGLIYESEREWSDETSTTCGGYDTDGNVFQVTQATRNENRSH
jgi:catechol 2,3-dioxygenase-like lactoylglutathione lyase family enzyme